MNLSTKREASDFHSGGAPNVRKFLFERTFDDDLNSPKDKKFSSEKEVKAVKEPTYSREQLESEKSQAYDAGFHAGKKALANDQQNTMNALLADIGQKLAVFIAEADNQFHQQLAHAQEVALTIMRKLMPVYIERCGLEEIESIVSQVLAERSHEPRLVLRVGESRFDAISEKIKTISEQKAFAGKIIVLCEESLGASDCRIEWADGGMERDIEALWKTIEHIMGAEHMDWTPQQRTDTQEPTAGESAPLVPSVPLAPSNTTGMEEVPIETAQPSELNASQQEKVDNKDIMTESENVNQDGEKQPATLTTPIGENKPPTATSGETA